MRPLCLWFLFGFYIKLALASVQWTQGRGNICREILYKIYKKIQITKCSYNRLNIIYPGFLKFAENPKF